jgi:hypothetical protein
MYNHIYEEMVASGIAETLMVPVWCNQSGEEVEKDEAYGRPVTHRLLHPNYLLFVDEVGSNTDMEGDGHVGGEVMVVGRGEVATQRAASSDNHFTVLGFTAATGDPVMCAIIFEGDEIRPEVATGLDIFAPVVGDERDDDFFIKNSGEGKRFPLGPTCTYHGKEVPCAIACSESGSITSSLLAGFLEVMDELDLFPRVEGWIQVTVGFSGIHK